MKMIRFAWLEMHGYGMQIIILRILDTAKAIPIIFKTFN
jgi:hypothetical protein